MEDQNLARQYWLVGASWGGVDPQYEKFVEGGYWQLGWSEGFQRERAKKMKRGDFIAIKKADGPGVIQILHLGEILEANIDADALNRTLCTVRWLRTGIEDRVVKGLHGAFQSVHGPFTLKDEKGENSKDCDWIREIFCL